MVSRWGRRNAREGERRNEIIIMTIFFFKTRPVAASLDIFRTPTPMWRTVSQARDDNSAWEGNALKATTMHHLAARYFSNPRTIDERSPKRGMTQCLERGTPERDDASKPSRETIVSGNDFLPSRACVEMPSKSNASKGSVSKCRSYILYQVPSPSRIERQRSVSSSST